MEKLMYFINKKSHIQYDMNCIEKYIHGGSHDQSLEKAWDEFENELKLVENEIELLSNPNTKEVEVKKLELMDQIKEHKKEIHKLKRQVESLERMITVES